MNDRIDAIRARLNAATPGPWAIWHDLDHQGFTTVGDADSYEEILAHGECEESNPTAHVYVEEDAEFIANAPGDVAFLLAELDTAREREARLLAKIPEAWKEGTEAEAGERDGDEYTITMLCSMANPYLDWSEPDDEGFMHSSPTQDPFKEEP